MPIREPVVHIRSVSLLHIQRKFVKAFTSHIHDKLYKARSCQPIHISLSIATSRSLAASRTTQWYAKSYTRSICTIRS